MNGSDFVLVLSITLIYFELNPVSKNGKMKHAKKEHSIQGKIE